MWSKRENRIYFWNKTNGESLWEMPPLRPNVQISLLLISRYPSFLICLSIFV
jgi:hypothetical protein